MAHKKAMCCLVKNEQKTKKNWLFVVNFSSFIAFLNKKGKKNGKKFGGY